MPVEAVSQATTKSKASNGEGKIITLPGVQLEIPLGKEVIIRIPDVEQTYKGKIVGYDPYDYLIAQVRLPAKVRQDLTFGGQLIVKYVHQGAVYGFRAVAQNAINTPAPLVFFEYPSFIEKIALRRTSRSNCNIDGLLQTMDKEYDCMVINVSETGCKLSVQAGTRDPLADTQVGDTMVISMTLGHQGSLKLPIAVRNLSLEKGILSMGAMFLDINKNEVAILNQYLAKITKLNLGD